MSGKKNAQKAVENAEIKENAETKETDGTLDMEKITEKQAAFVEIEPVAFEIILKAIHPHATYGRCGYRFNKETALEIARSDLTDEQIIELANDPYLEFVPVVKE